MTERLSILIITYNREEDTLELLKSLKTQVDYEQYIGEVLLLNNASTVSYDRLKVYIAEHPEMNIRYIEHTENLGVARGRNYLIKEAKYPLLLVLDDDVVFDDVNGIRNAATTFNQPLFAQNNTAIVSFCVFYYDTLERQKNAFPHKKQSKYIGRQQFLTSYFIGGAHLVRRTLFDEIGLYPTTFFYGTEEYDLGFRILNAGYTVGYSEAVKVLHKESPFGRVTNSEKQAMLWYNKSTVAWKYLPKKYFYTTAILWSLLVLKKTGFDLKTWFKTWPKIMRIPKDQVRTPISKEALNYIDSVEGRLWY